jgi:hypothetical protein
MTLSHRADIKCSLCGADGDVRTEEEGLVCRLCYEDNEPLLSRCDA